MNKKQKLELTWIGKDKRPRLEPRILLEDKALSYRADNPITSAQAEIPFDEQDNTSPKISHNNLLIHGDNLLALKALEQQYAGKVKCVFIDPPYNTGSAFTHYDDGVEHSLWLSLMRDRLEAIRTLLAEDGSLWITIDDNECHYLKVLCDEIFGRQSFVATCVWEKDKGGRGDADISLSHDNILIYAKDRTLWSKYRNLMPRTETQLGRFKNPGYLTEVRDGVAPRTWWSADEVGTNQQAKRDHLNKLLTDIEPFATPKPEGLIQRIIHIATNTGDLVLDSFAGSGTTGAVAQKMGRRWIMVELGDHCETHIVPRLKKVIDGEDQGGISKAVNWQGGGGFRYFRLAPSLLKKDTWGNWIINKAYNAEMLSEAMCKHMGFQYAPSQAHFWMHGHSTETDFIYVTTGSLSHDQLKVISDEVGNNRSLLICCKAFMAETSAFANLTLKKIPQAILHKCEWDHDDYSFSLNVLPDDESSEDLEISQVLDNEEE